MPDVINISGLPTWALVLVLLASPLLAFVGAALGPVLVRVGEKEAETRWQREKALEHMRWAVEMSASDDARKALIGWTALDALADSPLLHKDDLDLIHRVSDVAVGSTPDEVSPEEVDVDLADETGTDIMELDEGER